MATKPTIDDYHALDAELAAGRESGHSEAEDDALLERMDVVWWRLPDSAIEALTTAKRTPASLAGFSDVAATLASAQDPRSRRVDRARRRCDATPMDRDQLRHQLRSAVRRRLLAASDLGVCPDGDWSPGDLTSPPATL